MTKKRLPKQVQDNVLTPITTSNSTISKVNQSTSANVLGPNSTKKLGLTNAACQINSDGTTLNITSDKCVNVFLTENITEQKYIKNITGGAVALNVWHHIALTRQGTQVRLFLNGVQQGSTWTNPGPTNLGSATFYIGWYPTSTEFNGYVDDFRVTKGIARYVNSFTPPQRPFPNQ